MRHGDESIFRRAQRGVAVAAAQGTTVSAPTVAPASAPAVHSVSRVVFTVPELETAVRFYSTFGLKVQRGEGWIDLQTYGHDHTWMRVVEGGDSKRLQFVSFGMYARDEAAFRARVAALGLGCEPHPLGDAGGLWLRTPDGVRLQLVVMEKVSPLSKTVHTARPLPARGLAAAPARSQATQVRPRYLSHILLFTPDLPRMLDFCLTVLGLRLSDRSGNIIAFTHSAHGSDHHLLALVQDAATGLHHTSWDVGSLDEVGEGSEQMRNAGYAEGWGVGRHVLGSNYFYYARDPWGSFSEYSFDIDYVAPDADWTAGDYAPEDSLYVWGPAVPPWFVKNFEHSAPCL